MVLREFRRYHTIREKYDVVKRSSTTSVATGYRQNENGNSPGVHLRSGASGGAWLAGFTFSISDHGRHIDGVSGGLCIRGFPRLAMDVWTRGRAGGGKNDLRRSSQKRKRARGANITPVDKET